MGILPEVEQPLKKVPTYIFVTLYYLIATIQRQADLDINHFVHLFDMLPDPPLRHGQARRCRPPLLVKSHPGLQ